MAQAQPSVSQLADFGPDDLPDLTGRRAVVTGGNSGIGFEAARALADHGAHVTIASRNPQKAEAAVKNLPHGTEAAPLDLASLDSVRSFTQQMTSPIDILVCNAGIMATPQYRETVDGFELQFGTNHLGHFALAGLLLPQMLKAEAARVAVVSSLAHHDGDASVLKGNKQSPYNARAAYGNSKLANLLFAQELQRRATAAGSALSVAAGHPGFSATGLVGSPDGLGARPIIGKAMSAVVKVISQSPADGAKPTLWAATYGAPGSYVGPTQLRETRGRLGEAKISALATDEQLATKLWTASEEATGVRYDWQA